MARHTITIAELNVWINTETWHTGASSHGDGSSKSLDWDGVRTFRVKDHNKTVYLGPDKAAAVAAYNEAY